MRLLLLGFAVLVAVRAAAQPAVSSPENLATGPVAATVAVPAAAPDTAAAIHRLFVHKRRQSGGLLALSAVSGAVGVVTASQLVWSKNATASGIGIASFALAAYVALPVAVVELVQLIRFSQRREQRALNEFSAHRLPRSLRKKLKPKYFRPDVPAR